MTPGEHREGMGLPVWFSKWARITKYHIDERCAGLEHVHDDARDHRVLASWYAMVRHETSRPCRRCALEAAIGHIWHQPALRRGPDMTVTFSSQGRLDEWRTAGYAADAWAFTDSGAARLVRIAERLSLPVCDTVVGPVTVATVPRPLALVVARNFRTYFAPVTADASRLSLDALWALLSRTPPELDAGAIDASVAWTLAQAIAA